MTPEREAHVRKRVECALIDADRQEEIWGELADDLLTALDEARAEADECRASFGSVCGTDWSNWKASHAGMLRERERAEKAEAERDAMREMLKKHEFSSPVRRASACAECRHLAPKHLPSCALAALIGEVPPAGSP